MDAAVIICPRAQIRAAKAGPFFGGRRCDRRADTAEARWWTIFGTLYKYLGNHVICDSKYKVMQFELLS